MNMNGRYFVWQNFTIRVEYERQDIGIQQWYLDAHITCFHKSKQNGVLQGSTAWSVNTNDLFLIHLDR